MSDDLASRYKRFRETLDERRVVAHATITVLEEQQRVVDERLKALDRMGHDEGADD